MTEDRSWCRNRQRLPCPASGDESCGVRRSTRRSFASSPTRYERSASTCWDEGCTRRCCTGRPRPGSIARRTQCSRGRDLEAAPQGGVLHHAAGGAGPCPPGLRRPGGGDRAVASRAGGGQHRDRRRGSRRRGGRIGSDRRVPGQVYPVLVGGGIPFFPQRERRVDLELAETRTFSSSLVYLRYRVGALGGSSAGPQEERASQWLDLDHPAQFSQRALVEDPGPRSHHSAGVSSASMPRWVSHCSAWSQVQPRSMVRMRQEVQPNRYQKTPEARCGRGPVRRG